VYAVRYGLYVQVDFRQWRRIEEGHQANGGLLMLLQAYIEVAVGKTAHMHGGSAAASVAAHIVGTAVLLYTLPCAALAPASVEFRKPRSRQNFGRKAHLTI
jgi:hypothetical protein